MSDKEEQKVKTPYPFFIHDQYVKDISFENPNYLVKYSETDKQSQVSVNVETNVIKLNDDNYEVTMSVSAKSTLEETSIFVLELVYACVISIARDIEHDILEQILLVHCPFLMFPFAREAVASITRYGGYPPLVIEPIDFSLLYIEKKKALVTGGEEGASN
ncbi:MAG: protein-export chaperone SecB [Holosporales bacterium]|jgi:preprotein translocase subunit SecB|nr:protein-export chaperone SecB [Holosporales bacterium]